MSPIPLLCSIPPHTQCVLRLKRFFLHLMASSMSSPALSPSQSGNLLQILRRANAHYSHVALIIRTSIHPTHHARKRAAALKLTISIQKALKLDPKQISTIPLPELDTAVTPFLSMGLGKAVVGRERELARARANHSLVKCTIPSYPHTGPPSSLLSPISLYSCVPLSPDIRVKTQRLTSRWSMTPIDPDSDVAQTLAQGIAITYNPNYNQDMLPCSPTKSGESVRFTVKPVSNDSNAFSRHLSTQLDVAKPLSWYSDISSSSASTMSSRGPATPVRSVLLADFLHHSNSNRLLIA